MADLEDDEQPIAVEDDSERPTLGARIASVAPPPIVAAQPQPDAPPMPKQDLDMSKMPDVVKMLTGPSSIPEPPTGANNPQLADLAKKQAVLSTPINPRDASGNTKPQYRMGLGTRILGGLAAAAEGFGGHQYTGPYIGPGATNRRYAQDEAQRQGELAGVDTQIGTQEKLDAENQKLYNLALKQAYDTQRGEALQETAAAREESAKNRGLYEQSQAELNKVKADALRNKPDSPADQRATDADKYGLTGQARKDYILTGKLPKDMMGSQRQPTELETWMDAFQRENGRKPTADEIANRKSKTKMSGEVEDQRNTAWIKARREYDQALQKLDNPNDQKAIQELREDYYQKRQDAQDNYESGIRRLGGKAEHVELPRDHFGEGGARPVQAQPGGSQPAANTGKYKIGDVVNVKGKGRGKIVGINPTTKKPIVDYSGQ